MRKYKILFVGVLLSTVFNVSAQSIVKEISYDLFEDTEKSAKFSMESVSINAAGDLQIGAFIQRKALIDNKKTFQVFKEGYFPGVKIYSFDKELNKKLISVKNINLNSIGDYNNSEYKLIANSVTEIGNSDDDMNYEDLQKRYSEILKAKNTDANKAEYFLEIEKNLKKRVFEGRFDIISNSVIKVETAIEKVNLEYPETDILRKKFGYGLSNDNFDKFIFASGLYYDKKDIKADAGKKWNEYRQYEFNSFDIEGMHLNSYNIDFDFPKIIKFNSQVITNGKFEGYLYIFGYMPGAKKYNNKETNNKYWALYFDENGKLIFEKEFESVNNTLFYSVHKFDDTLYLLVQGNEYKYGVIKISDSDYEQVNLSVSDLKTNTVNGSYENGLKKSFTPIYNNNQVFVNEEGSFISILENKISKPVVKDGTSTTVVTYKSFAVQFDKEGKFIKQYILPVKASSSKSFQKQYNLLTLTSEKFVLLSEETLNSKPNKTPAYSIFYTSDPKEKVTKNRIKNQKSPVVTVIDILKSEINATTVTKEPFVKLSEAGYYYSDGINNCLYFVGTDKSRSKLVISKIKY